MTCAYCEQTFPCEPNQDACPGCRECGACESCGKAPAIGDIENPWLCAECLSNWIDNQGELRSQMRLEV